MLNFFARSGLEIGKIDSLWMDRERDLEGQGEGGEGQGMARECGF